MKRILLGTGLSFAMLVPGIRAVSALQDQPAPTTAYTVQPGDTLWGIARRIEPAADPRVVVDRVMRLNELSSPDLLPGQSLQLPR